MALTRRRTWLATLLILLPGGLSAAGWHIEPLGYAQSTSNEPVAVDSQGQPHIVSVKNNGQLDHAVLSDGSWIVTPLEPPESANHPSQPTIKIGPADVIHVAYQKGGDLKYGRKQNGAWTVDTIPAPGPNAGWHANLAIGSQGYAHLSYVFEDSETSQGRLGYARWDGSQWIIETVPTNEISLSCGLALDAADRPHIIYRDESGQTIRYVTWRDGVWRDELPYPKQVNDSAAHSGAIVIDSQGRPHLFIAVLNPIASERRLVHVYRDGSNWVSAVIEQMVEGFVGPSAVIDSSDVIRLAYIHSGFKYAVRTTGVWTKESVSSSGGTKASLAVGPDGGPHFFLANSNNLGWFAYAHTADVEPPVGTPCLSAYVKSPNSGKKISGNRVTVLADTACDDAGSIEFVRFEYRPAEGAWSSIVPANDQHTNPDAGPPYFVHWNVDELANGAYEVRAVGGNGEAEDPAPAPISLIVDHTNPDLVEDKHDNDHSKKVERIHNNRSNVVISERAGRMVEVRVPSGALADGDLLLSLILKSSLREPPPQNLSLAGPSIELSLSNGQHDLSDVVEIEFPYQDDNDDGREDRTNKAVSSLAAWYFNEQSREWERIASRVDPSRKVVIAETRHFSLFALLSGAGGGSGTSETAFRLGEVFCYPNPLRNRTTATIQIEVAAFDDVDLFIYDIAGDLIHKKDLGGLPLTNGRLSYVWDISQVPSGNYVYRVLVKNGDATAKAAGVIGIIK